MKFIDKKPTKKVKEETPKKSSIPKITQKEQNSVDEWMRKHLECSRRYGIKTAAWFGLQWANCPDYINIECGCGAIYQQKTPHSEPIIIEKGKRNG